MNKRFLSTLGLLLALSVNQVNADTFALHAEKSNVEGRIGVLIGRNGHISCVHSISPAARAGLHPGDYVTMVDNHKPLDIDEIPGVPGTKVSLQIKRNDVSFNIEIERIDWREIHQ